MPEYALRVDPVAPGDGPEAELRSLLRWLREDEALGRGLRATIGSDPAPAPPARSPHAPSPPASVSVGPGAPPYAPVARPGVPVAGSPAPVPPVVVPPAAVSGRAGVAPHAPVVPPGGSVPATPMGSPGFDVLQLAVGSGLSVASLVFSVLQWQASRRQAPTLTVTRDGYEVRLTGDAADDPEALRRIVAALEPAVPRDGNRDGVDDGAP